MEKFDLDLYYKKTIEGLKLLAMPFTMQKTYYEDFVEVPFEVLDTFDDIIIQLPKLIEGNRFTNMQIASLLRLHNRINFVITDPDLRNLDEMSFSDDNRWNNIREMAKESLIIMNEPIIPPDSKYI